MQIRKQDIPEGWSKEAADFTNRLIQRKPINRLGLNGPDEVKGHPWFKNFNWTLLHNKEIVAPFIPEVYYYYYYYYRLNRIILIRK